MNSSQRLNSGILFITVLGVIAVMVGTHWGIGISPDSVAYIAGARNLASGNGFSTLSINGSANPITFRGPFYSMLLAVFSLLGSDPMEVARWLNALLFGISIFIVGKIISPFFSGVTKRAIWPPIIFLFLMLVSASMLEIHFMAWSEATFIALSLGGFIAIGIYLDQQNFVALVLGGLLFGLAILTRYAGIALLISGFLGIILFNKVTFKNRVRDAALFGIVSMLPLMYWWGRNFILTGTTSGREIIYHPIGVEQIKQGLTTVSSWLLIPQNSSALIKVIPILLIFVGLIYISIKSESEPQVSQKGFIKNLGEMPGIIKLILLFLPVYGAFLLISISLVDANTPLDGRILSIVFVTGLILVCYVVSELLKLQHNSRAVWGVFMLAGIVFAVVYAIQGASFLGKSLRDGIGFNSLVWQNSETLAQVMHLPQTYTIYTNSPEAIYVHTNRLALSLPKKYNGATQTVNENYQAESVELGNAIEADQAVIVYFNAIQKPTLPTEEELLENMPIYVLVTTSDGVIFASKLVP